MDPDVIRHLWGPITRRRPRRTRDEQPVMLRPRARKLTLSLHLAVSVGWIGTVVAYLALSVAAANSDDVQVIRAAWIGMALIGWYVIVPLAVASLLTGLVIAVGTRWGLFRHYWVIFSLVLTIVATVVLIQHMPGVSDLADVARRGTSTNVDQLDAHLYGRLRQGDFLHPGLGLIVLLVIQVLNVHKPPGLTRYGRRKQREESARTSQVVEATA
jgi:hypothetical protein